MLNVLSLDGGPGPLTDIHVVRFAELLFPGFLDEVDLFAGVSDGGMMSLYLALQATLGRDALAAIDGCIRFSSDYNRAFRPSALDLLQFALGRRPLTQGDRLRKVLEAGFTSDRGTPHRVGDLRKKIAIVAFNTDYWGSRIFRNFGLDPADPEDVDNELTLLDVALATSAFPGVLPIHGGPDNIGFLDGFLICNNPTLSAVTLAVRDLVFATGFDRKFPYAPTACADSIEKLPADTNPFRALKVLSLGVSQTDVEARLERRGGVLANLVMLTDLQREKRKLAGHGRLGLGQAAWGWIDLVKRPSLWGDFLLHGPSREADRNCRRLLGPVNYHRFEPRVDLMRSVFNLVLLRDQAALDDLEQVASEVFGDLARRYSGDDAARSDVDRSVNANKVKNLIAFVGDAWFKDGRRREPSRSVLAALSSDRTFPEAGSNEERALYEAARRESAASGAASATG